MKKKFKFKKSIYELVMILFLLVINSQSIGGNSLFCDWEIIDNPLEPCSQLYSVSTVSEDDVWAVGSIGRIIHWNGSSWKLVTSPANYDLFSVFMLNSNDGWAVGAGGAIIHWNGSSWEVAPYPPQLIGILRSVFMLNSSCGWAVGSDDIIYWDGSKWSLVDRIFGQLNSVFMLSSSNGWAVGLNGRILHWDGKDWKFVSSLTKHTLTSVFMVDASDGWAVGSSGVILHWDGSGWSLMESPTDSGLLSIFMVHSNSGWAVGEDIVHWDGSRWNLVEKPQLNEGSLFSVSMLNPLEGWTVGIEWKHVGNATGSCPVTLHFVSPDVVPPFIGQIDIEPENPTTEDNVTVTCLTIDYETGIKEVNLFYSVNEGNSWNKIPIEHIGDSKYNAIIPKQSGEISVQYYIESTDKEINTRMSDLRSFSIKNPPTKILPYIGFGVISAIVIILVLIKVARKRV